MVDARSARFQGMVPGSWGAPPARRVDTSTLAGVQAASRPAPPRPQPPAPQPPRPQPVPATQNGGMDDWYLQTWNQNIDEPITQPFVTEFLRNYAPFSVGAREQGNTITASDALKDVGLSVAGAGIGAGIGSVVRAGVNALPAGFLAGGAKGAASSFDDLARANSINRYLKRPVEYYQESGGAPIMRKFFEETSERIPAGRELYRVPAFDEVLPTNIGATWSPNRVLSASGSQDLQILGEVLSGIRQTGGRQYLNPRMIKFTTMDNLPGIRNINEYLARSNVPNAFVSDFAEESLLGPATQYILENFIPGTGSQPPTWFFNALSR